MRIIGGKFKGRIFSPPADRWPTRPTTDFSKEALFNIIENNLDIPNLRVLDLFCGSGSHSYEFASRGCKDITAVDNFLPCINFVKKMCEQLEIAQYVRIVRSDAFKFLENSKEQFDYIFAGPPYALMTLHTLPDVVFAENKLKPGGWMVLEHNPHHKFEHHPHFVEVRRYGQTIFSIFENPNTLLA